MAQPVLNITILGTFIDNDTPEKKRFSEKKKIHVLVRLHGSR